MKIELGNVLTANTLQSLGEEKYNHFRNALEFIGYTVNPDLGDWFNPRVQTAVNEYGINNFGVVLQKEGLVLQDIRNYSANEITLPTIDNLITLTLVAG
mgnify:CR=1 FL=1